MRRRWMLLQAAGIALLLVSCSGGGGPADRAGAVLDETVAQSSDHAEYAARILAEGRSPFCTERLTALTRDKKYTIAQEAIRGYADHPELEGEAVLREAFENVKGRSKILAAVGLARRGDDTALTWLKDNFERTAGAAQKLTMRTLVDAGASDAVIPVIQRYLGSKEPTVRNQGYDILGDIDTDWSRDLLRQGLDKEFGEERLGPIVALGRVGTPEDATRIAKFHNTRGLVFGTAEALGHLGNAEVAERPLRKLVAEDEESAQAYAGAALLRLGLLAEDDPTLRNLAEFVDPRVRETLANQLRGIEDDRARELLAKLSADEEGSVREAALFALSREPDPDDRSLYLARLEDNSYPIVSLALETLAKIGTAEDVSAIEPFLEHQIPYLRIASAVAIGEIESRQG